MSREIILKLLKEMSAYLDNETINSWENFEINLREQSIAIYEWGSNPIYTPFSQLGNRTLSIIFKLVANKYRHTI